MSEYMIDAFSPYTQLTPPKLGFESVTVAL
jgi:hypothetical protein